MGETAGNGAAVPADDSVFGTLVSELGDRSLTVATAESLTAGLLAARIADPTGASAVLRGGLVVYATDLKESLAGVARETVETYGVISAETALALARGARSTCGADIGIGLTGVAGPDTQEDQPVGTVYIGLSGEGVGDRSQGREFPGGRQEVREAACRAAVTWLLTVLGNESGVRDVEESDA